MGKLVAERETINYDTIKEEMETKLEEIINHFENITRRALIFYNSFCIAKCDYFKTSGVLSKEQIKQFNAIYEKCEKEERRKCKNYYIFKTIEFGALIKRDTKGLVNVVDTIYSEILLSEKYFKDIRNLPTDKNKLQIMELISMTLYTKEYFVLWNFVKKMYKLAVEQNNKTEYSKAQITDREKEQQRKAIKQQLNLEK